MGLLVKCGIAACGMRKVKCGMECAESYCGTVGNTPVCGMRKVALSAVGCVFNLLRGVQGWGWGRSVDQNIGLGTYSTDFSCKFQLRKFHKLCERKFNSIVKNFTKLIKLSKKVKIYKSFGLSCWLFLQADVGSVKCRSHYARMYAFVCCNGTQ